MDEFLRAFIGQADNEDPLDLPFDVETLERAAIIHPFDRRLKQQLFTSYIDHNVPIDHPKVVRLIQPFETILSDEMMTIIKHPLAAPFEYVLWELMYETDFTYEVRLSSPDMAEMMGTLEADSIGQPTPATLLPDQAGRGSIPDPDYHFEISHQAIFDSISRRTRNKVELFRWGAIADLRPLVYGYAELALYRTWTGYEVRYLGIALESPEDTGDKISATSMLLDNEELASRNKGPAEVNYWVRHKFTVL